MAYKELRRDIKKVRAAVGSVLEGETGPAGVGLLFGPTVNLIVGMMGVIASGHFFCPLSPADPAERVLNFLADGEIEIVLTSKKDMAAGLLLALINHQVLYIEDILAGEEQNDTVLTIDPHGMCALLYTSGSTGKPKGVTHSHSSLLQMAMEKVNRQKISPSDQIAGLSSPMFGGFYWTVLGALLTGASLHLFDLLEQTFAPLGDWLVEKKISYTHFTPTTMRYFLDTLAAPTAFPDLRLVSLGGETVLPRDVQRFYQLVEAPTVLGSTGATVETWFYAAAFFQRPFPETVKRIPMGFINNDSYVLIRDASGTLLAENQVGEITVSSQALSPGYWKRDDLNATRYSAGTNGKRFFFSGDLGLIDSNGLVYHEGREDFQLKVRGIRVEPGEIEAALHQYPQVAEAAVVGSQVTEEEIRLVGYIVLRPDSTASTLEIQGFLKDRLPAYLIPSQFIFLESMPLTRSQKIDRTRLPAPDELLFKNTIKNGAPDTALEKTIFAIWKQVLGHSRFGTKDFFIDIGGDSIQAMRVRNLLEKELGTPIPLGDFIDAGSIEMLAEIVERRRQNSA